MMKKVSMSAVVFAVVIPLMAETETVGGYTWTYRSNGGTAEIYNGSRSAISPSPIGAVTIPSTLGGKLVMSIGSHAFYYCSGLTSIMIPSSVTNIGISAFYGCSSLTSITIPRNVTSIASYAFYDCRGLTNVTVPGNVTNIGNGAFSGCSGLEAFEVVAGNPSYKAVFGLLLTKDGKTLVAVPGRLTSVTIPDNVTNIGASAFANCMSLTSVTIPDNVKHIGQLAFESCTKLESFVVSSTNKAYKAVFGLLLTEDGETLVAVPGGLSSVTIPDSVTSIGEHAFRGCHGLTSVTIPNGVTSVGHGAFSYCSNLSSVTIPDSVTSIGDYAFYCCRRLMSVTIPSSVTSIGNWAFGFCQDLESVILMGNAPRVGSDTFRSVNTRCTVYAAKDSTGWGQIPGTWNGVSIQYRMK